MATTKKAAKTAAPAKEAPARRGRVGQYQGKKLVKQVDKWPNKPGTNIAASFALIRNNMTYEQYIAAGGTYVNLKHLIRQEFVKLV